MFTCKLFLTVFILAVVHNQVEGQVSVLPSPPSDYPTSFTSVQQLVFCGQTDVPLTGVLATQPVAAVSPGYQENSAGDRIGLYNTALSECTNTFAVPANTPISIFVQFEDIPNVAGGDSCTNSKLVFTGASGSDRSLTTCNTANNGNLVRYAAETSAYTLTVSFTPSALENRGLGYLLLLSTFDASSAAMDGAFSDIACPNTMTGWRSFIFQAAQVVTGTTAGDRLTACKVLCNNNPDCQFTAIVDDITGSDDENCFLGRFDFTGTALSIPTTAPRLVSILETRLASTVGVASLSSFTRRTNFNCFTPFFHRTTSFLSSTAGSAECRARCLLNCEQSGAGDAGQSEDNLCQYWTMYDNRCVTGNLANMPATTGDQTNPFVKDTRTFNGHNPLVPIWFTNPTTGTLDLVNSFPTTARDECSGFTANQVIEAITDANPLNIAAGHTTATGGTADPCNIYIQNKNQLELTLTLSVLAPSTPGTYQVIIGRAHDNGVQICELDAAAETCVWTDELAVIRFADTATGDPSTNALTLQAAAAPNVI